MLTKEPIRRDVYDLTVEETHDFFANGILVLNCMDAVRYASTSVFIKGHGRVVEAKGQESSTAVTNYKSRRVVSSL